MGHWIEKKFGVKSNAIPGADLDGYEIESGKQKGSFGDWMADGTSGTIGKEKQKKSGEISENSWNEQKTRKSFSFFMDWYKLWSAGFE